ncbi:ATP-dependent helicase [Nakamurella sp. DB0629]|uniref:ATP-dependent helicase n=1 Tax=Nakamurella aerolata TaxID=1656892 RepID=A0A849A4G6_9ACTN|nr:ATP-dependent helicase [Nakamurella aerolata]NNG34957.1 ATP-dependent helicase [Nakamurella aerolata]
MARFSPLVRQWFGQAFAEPTAAQAGAWDAIGKGEHTLVVAPTGSGKTLAAFLSAIDRIVTRPEPPSDPHHRCGVIYLSPIKALAVDVERNLRSPLAGLAGLARAQGGSVPDVTVAVRSGDTPAADRRDFARNGADILITTPESLFLLLTSQAREMFAGVHTVIVDEVHSIAGSKRGAHLAVSLDRLDALLERPAQRIGLSATVRPVEEAARFLAGGRPVTTVAPPARKVINLDVTVPVEDMTALGQVSATDPDLSGAAAGDPRRSSIWPHVEEQVVDLITAHRSTIVFANSRRLAERLTARINEIHAERTGEFDPQAARDAKPPAQLMAQSDRSHGTAAVLAKAHHGSVSHQQRAVIEDELKQGVLPAVVATSSLELGIDMGAVDLVIQVEAPPSVAGGLQRIGRAGHQVGAPSHGVLFPKFRGDLLASAVVAERMLGGEIEQLRIPSLPLDVLAQQIVAIIAMDSLTVPELQALLRRSAPYATLGRGALDAVLDMLSGRYPSEEFGELRPRLVWDRATDRLTARRNAQTLAVTSGGTIPDRGLFGVFLATEGQGSGGAGRRVGELDEEMVYESRVGDVFALGSSSWRIVEITHDRVLVLPASGLPGRLPFWKGDTLGRPAELGTAHGAFVRELATASQTQAQQRLSGIGLDGNASANLLEYLSAQTEATGVLPDEKTIVLERFRDELGDWRVVLHSPYGAAVHAPWALVLAARLRERFGVDVSAMHADDGIVLRLPDLGGDDDADPLAELPELITLDPGTVTAEVTEQIGGSAVFAARFRECAARALLLPRRQIGARQPLWQQRLRATALLEVASRYPSFPIVAEAVRECLQDVFDVPALVAVQRGLADRSVRLVPVQTPAPSPFASSLLFGYVAQFIYDGDSPLAERRAAALTLDPDLLAELLGGADAPVLSDLLDADTVTETERGLQRLTPERKARSDDDIADLLRILGPLTAAEIAERSVDELDVPAVLNGLRATRRVIDVRVGGREVLADPADAPLLRDGLGVALPQGIAASLLDTTVDEPIDRLIGRYARTRGPFVAAAPAARFGIGVAVALDALRRLQSAGRIAEGDLRPAGSAPVDPLDAAAAEHATGAGGSREFVDAEVLRLLRRRSLASLRSEVEPATSSAFAAFLPAWNGIGAGRGQQPLRGVDGVLRAVEQLAGARVPASALESLILPARVPGYSPAMLDELMTSGEVVWAGHGALGTDDGWVSLHPADTASLTLPEPPADLPDSVQTPLHQALLRVLGNGGGYFFRELADAVARNGFPGADPAGNNSVAGVGSGAGAGAGAARGTGPVTDTVAGAGGSVVGDEALGSALWDLVFAGLVSGDTIAPLRARLAGGRTAHRPGGRSRGQQRLRLPSRGRLAAVPRAPRLPPHLAGRWSLLPPVETDPTVRAHANAELLLERHGVVTRGAAVAEETPGGFGALYRVLSAFEESGRVRRGYFVEGLGAAQFATAGAVDRLRAGPVDDSTGRRGQTDAPVVVLAAADPANPYGAALPWPERTGASAPASAQGDPASAPAGAETASAVGTGGAGTAGAAAVGTGQASAGATGAGTSADAAPDSHRPARRAGALVVLRQGRLLLYAERGGRSLLSFTDDQDELDAAATALASAVLSGHVATMTITRVDGVDAVGPQSRGAVLDALQRNGFTVTPRGLRLRTGVR